MSQQKCRCGEQEHARRAERLAAELDRKRVNRGPIILTRSSAQEMQAALESAASVHASFCGCSAPVSSGGTTDV